jgi:hypothetical protein
MAHVVLFMMALGALIIAAACLKEMWDWFDNGR